MVAIVFLAHDHGSKRGTPPSRWPRRAATGRVDDHDPDARPARRRPAAPNLRPHHRRDLAEVGRRDRNRPRVRAEHDVPAHHDRVHRRGVAREDDSRPRRPRELRVPRPSRAVTRCARGGCGRSRSSLLLRHQLLDVRRRLRSRGQRQLQGPRRSLTELRVPPRPEAAGDHRSRAGRDGAEVHRGHARQSLHPRDQLVLVRPERHRPRNLQGDPAHPARHRSARHRGEQVVERRLRRGDGLHRRRPHRSADVRALLVPGRRPFAPPGGARPDRSVPVHHAQRRRSRREAGHDHRRGDRARRDRQPAPQHGDLARRHRALRRELRVEHRHEAARVRHEHRANRRRSAHIRSGSRSSRATRRVWVACYSGEIVVFDA